ncbi:MAG: carboxypeptidase-like regulatory domain-containing protein [Bacteroidota bacterium]|nr:carboxypeptidase-like regulatory domain-containing protein [Bacteroidota bacterium]
MYKTFMVLCIVLISTYSFSQKILTGKILDEKTEQPIESAVVNVVKYNKAVITDAEGNFEINIPADTCFASISMIGYQTKNIELWKTYPNVIFLKNGPVNLKEVVITPQSNLVSFHNLSEIDLNMRPVNSSQDLMRLVPGLFLGQHQGGGVAEHIFFRGFDADHGTDVNVSVDDMPLNLVSQAHGQGFADLHFLIPELVTKYQFGKGPYYAPYGDFETAGFVSFTTADVLNKSMVKVEGGQFNTGRIMAMVNLLSDKAKQRGENAYIAAEDAYTDGPFDFAQHFNRFNVFGKYNVNISNKSRLDITLSTYSSGWRSSGEVPERAVKEGIIDRFGYIDTAQGGYTSRSNMIAKLTTRFSDRTTLENQIYYSKYFFNLHYDATSFADDSINGDQLRQRESRNLFGYNGKLTRRNYFNDNATLVSDAGIGMQFNYIDNSELSHTKNENTVLDYINLGNIKESTINGFLDENYSVGKWLINFGARLDYLYFDYADKLNPQQPSRSKVIASPKLNFEYTLNDRVQFYLKTGKGFHSNDAKAVIANKGLETLPAAYGADLGINWKPISHLYLNAALWYLQLQQEFTYDADEGTLSAGGRTRRQGIDLSARYQFNKWLFASFDINVCKARSLDAPKGSNYLPLAVPLSGTGGLDFKFADGFNGGLSYRYMKDRPANEDNTLIAQGYFVTDLTCNYTKRKYEVGLEIQNLFNTKWREAQFEVTSRLKNEPAPVDDISFTPGTPFFAKLKFAVFFK